MIKINKIKAACVLCLILTGFCAIAGINERKIIRTGENPLGLTEGVLDTVLQSASGQTATMPLGDVYDSFRIGYSVSVYSEGGIDFTEPGRFLMLITGDDGEAYGIGSVNSSGQGMMDFFVGDASLSNTNAFLDAGEVLYAYLIDTTSGYVIALESMNYSAEAWEDKYFQATETSSWTIVGSPDFDEDGFADSVERELGTDASDPLDYLRITAISYVNDNATIVWNTTNAPCTVLRSTNSLDAAGFETIASDISAGSYVDDSDSAKEAFYRVRADTSQNRIIE